MSSLGIELLLENGLMELLPGSVLSSCLMMELFPESVLTSCLGKELLPRSFLTSFMWLVLYLELFNVFLGGWNYYLEMGELFTGRNLLHLQAQSGRPERSKTLLRKCRFLFSLSCRK